MFPNEKRTAELRQGLVIIGRFAESALSGDCITIRIEHGIQSVWCSRGMLAASS